MVLVVIVVVIVVVAPHIPHKQTQETDFSSTKTPKNQQERARRGGAGRFWVCLNVRRTRCHKGARSRHTQAVPHSQAAA